jgi:hypothetical protein
VVVAADVGYALLALAAIVAPLALAGWLLGRDTDRADRRRPR